MPRLRAMIPALGLDYKKIKERVMVFVGPSSFNDPKNVTHIDRVYVKSVQPNITIKEAKFLYENGNEESILDDLLFQN